MAAIQDPTLVKLCAQLASRLSISLASARRQVEQAAAREGCLLYTSPSPRDS